jgi:hypothetical protein
MGESPIFRSKDTFFHVVTNSAFNLLNLKNLFVSEIGLARDMGGLGDRMRWWAGALLAPLPAHAVPIEGDMAGHAAGLLVILGTFAILLGIRNLRTLLHKQPMRRRDSGRYRTEAAAPSNDES